MKVLWAAPVALVLLATAALTPPRPEPAPDPWDEACRRGSMIENGETIIVTCSIVSSADAVNSSEPVEEPRPPYFPSPHAALPHDLLVDGRPGCTVGPVGTSKPVALSAAFTVMAGPLPNGADFDFGFDRRSWTGPLDADGRVVLELTPDELAPGESVRWRVRGTTEDDRLGIWSGWCTFTVAADAPDLRGLDPTQIDAIHELGLRPQRRYSVTLSAARWRTAMTAIDADFGDNAVLNEADPSDLSGEDDESVRQLRELAAHIRRQLPGAVTLTGAQWSTVAPLVAQWAAIVEEGNLEVDPESRTDTTVYWTVIDEISRQLGGPPHPRLGSR